MLSSYTKHDQREALTSIHDFPMIEHTLGEGLSSSMRAELTVETEGLGDREISLNGEHGCSWPLLFAEYLTTPLVQATVDTTDGVLGTLNLH